MRLEDDLETAGWLERLGGATEDFDWDAGNSNKHAKHGVTKFEIEAMLRHPLLFAGRIVEPRHEEERWLAVGITDEGRDLALIFTRRGARLRPNSGRPMRRQERSLYEDACQEAGDP